MEQREVSKQKLTLVLLNSKVLYVAGSYTPVEWAFSFWHEGLSFPYEKENIVLLRC